MRRKGDIAIGEIYIALTGQEQRSRMRAQKNCRSARGKK